MYPVNIIDESLLFFFPRTARISFGRWRRSNRASFCSPATMTRGFPCKNNVWGWLSVCRIVAVGNRACRLKNESDREVRRDGSRGIGARWRGKKKGTRELWKVWPALRLPMWSHCKGNYGLNSTFTGLGYLYYFWHHPICHCFRQNTVEQIGSGR